MAAATEVVPHGMSVGSRSVAALSGCIILEVSSLCATCAGNHTCWLSGSAEFFDGSPMSVSQSASNSSKAALLAYVNNGSSTPSSKMLWAKHTKGALYIASASWSNPVSIRNLEEQQYKAEE